MMLYWELFTVFFKIGLFSFGGGLAMISIIQQEVVGRGWIPASEYAPVSYTHLTLPTNREV